MSLVGRRKARGAAPGHRWKQYFQTSSTRIWLPPVCLLLSFSCNPAAADSTGLLDVCLQNDDGISSFISDIRELALRYDAAFTDGSQETEQQLLATAKTVPSVKPAGRVINVGFLLKSEVWVLAGNVGLARYQVALGVSDGTDPAQAQVIFGSIREKLGRKWKVTVLPPGTKAFPMTNCGGKPT